MIRAKAWNSSQTLVATFVDKDSIVYTDYLLNVSPEQDMCKRVHHNAESTHASDDSKAQQILRLVFRREEIRSCKTISHSSVREV